MKDAIAFVLGNFTLDVFRAGPARCGDCALARTIAAWPRRDRGGAVLDQRAQFCALNAGIIFYADLLIPLAGLLFLWLQRRTTGRVKEC